jgi:hypothetical protein
VPQTESDRPETFISERNGEIFKLLCNAGLKKQKHRETKLLDEVKNSLLI